jgi:uncharacterized protein (DUF488 family)
LAVSPLDKSGPPLLPGGAGGDLTKDVFTIGYEGLVQDQLLDLLSASGVEVLLDVRAVPLSRKAGFSKSVLGASLAARGIAYLHDRRLGTPKPGRDAARKGHTAEMARIFEAHLEGEAPQEALREATALAQTRRICLLCFERAPHDCHRAIVADRIHRETGLVIRHL